MTQWPSKQSMQKIFPKLRLQKRANTNWEMRPSKEGKTPWAVSDPDRAAWSRGLLPGVSAVRPTGWSCCNAQSTELQLVSRINHSQLNALMQSLSWNYSIMKYRSYPLTWHCSWNTVPLFWDKNEMPLTHSICTVKAQFWVEQKMHCHGNCFVWSVKRSGFYSFYKQYR